MEARGRIAAACVLSREAVRELDRKTIASGVASLDLMETAGARIAALLDDLKALGPAQRLLDLRGKSKSLLVLAGAGNNGGDGFVVARMLAERGWRISVGLCAGEPRAASDPAVNLQRWRSLGGQVLDAASTQDTLSAPASGGHNLVLDALFGTGLDRPIEGRLAETIAAANRSSSPVIAADIPSGLCANSGKVLGVAVRADATVTLGAAKPGLFLCQGPDYSGRVSVADIGLLDPATAGIASCGSVIDAATCRAYRNALAARAPMTHKGGRGHVLVIGGALGKTGAVLLAARAALRAGAGLVTMAVPATVARFCDAALIEAMTVELPDDGDGQLAADAWSVLHKRAGDFSTIVVGPGLGTGPGATQLVGDLLAGYDGPVVADADAINVVAGVDTAGEKLRSALSARRARKAGRLVFTPHPGEMARLRRSTVAEVQADRATAALELSRECDCTVVLKGAATVVCDGGEPAFNTSGNPGMAAAGMGDVLAGVIGAGIGGPRADFAEAVKMAVYWHGAAADLRCRQLGGPGFLASEVADCLPRALTGLAA